MMLNPLYASALLDWNLLGSPSPSRPSSLSAGLYRSPSGLECAAARQPIAFAPASTPAGGYAEATNSGSVAWSFSADDVAFGLSVYDQTGSIVCFGELASPLTATAGDTIKMFPGGLRVRLR